jgi:RNA polymerase sigma-70 factor, ECF subfamily
MDADLEALMARYQAGDFTAARSLIERLSPRLHSFFGAQAANRVDADDMLQDAWLRIHRVRHTYRPGRPLLPWVYAIARRVRVDHYRIAVRAAAREQRFEETTDGVPDTTADARPADELAELLAPLPASQREVLELLKLAGMSLEEVAQATSSSVGSVKQKVHRAYQKLRRTMGPMESDNRHSGVAP